MPATLHSQSIPAKNTDSGGAHSISAALAGHSGRKLPGGLLRGLVIALWIVAIWCFSWPVYRAFFNIQIDNNEGWNGYFADIAIHGGRLYPKADQLLTNNYPPLSFYMVGACSRIVGDTILAGRLLSLAAVAAIAFAIGKITRLLTRSPMAAWVAAGFYLATMSRFCADYVGMDDPQLLAQGFMSLGFAGFVAASQEDRSCVGPILLMAAAGFIKHNLIAMPAAALVWLAVVRPREAVRCAAFSLVAITIGFLLCRSAYGPDFLSNMTAPRLFSWQHIGSKLGRLHCLDVAGVASVCALALKRSERSVRLFGLLLVASVGTFLLQETGAGVDVNAAFELIIALAIGVGLAFAWAREIPLERFPRLAFWGAETLQIVLVLALFVRILPTRRIQDLRPMRMVFDPSFKAEIAVREAAMADSVALARNTPGEVTCATLVCYRAGKLTVDRFNVDQRIATGHLPADTLTKRFHDGSLTHVVIDPRADWDKPLDKKAASAN